MEGHGLIDRKVDDVVNQVFSLVRIARKKIIQFIQMAVTIVWFNEVELRRPTVGVDAQRAESFYNFIGIFLFDDGQSNI